MKARIAIAALLLAALPLADSEAFIFRRLRERRSARVSAPAKTTSRSGGRWSVAGRRSYSRDYIANHMLRTHSVDCSGMSVEQMQELHDDLHENKVKLPPPSKYSSGDCPSGKCPTPSATAPRASGGCPGGQCPTRSSPRSRGLFRR